MTTITIWLCHIQVRDIMCATILFLVRKSQLRDLKHPLMTANSSLSNCMQRMGTVKLCNTLIAAEDVVHHSRHWYMGPNSFSSWGPVYNWNPMHDCDVTCLPLCFTVCDFMIYMAGICMNPNNGMLNFQEPAIQNLRIQDLKKFSQHFMFLLILHAAAKVCVYTKN